MIRGAQRGFLYVEVLVALLVLALCLPAALNALSSAARAAAVERQTVTRRYRLVGLMEQVIATPYVALDAAGMAAGGATVPTSFSDAGGTIERRLVFIARYDADNADGDGNRFTGGDASLLWVRVSIDGQPAAAVETLIAS